jgi:SNF2 family DNA or RNA helicase
MKTVMVELGGKPCPANRICVDFPYDSEAVRAVKSVSGATFVKTPRKHWHVPLDMNTCRKLRKAFGQAMQIGPELYSWAQQASRQEAHLGSMALADTATLTRLPTVLPTLYRAVHVGPVGLTYTKEEEFAAALAQPGSYQCADVRFLADAPAPLNGNQQSLGKTLEWIAAVWEAGIEEGDHLVVCNTAAVDGTWEPELEQWQADAPKDVGIFACTGNRAQREATLKAWATSTAPVRWVIVNTQMIQWRKDPNGTFIRTIKAGLKAARTACRCDAHKGPHEHYTPPYPSLAVHTWRTVAVDECHKGSIRNDKSITHVSIDSLKYTDKRIAMSGTPSKKKGADIWGTLHWLRPDIFTSKFRFAQDYFDCTNNGFGWKIGELRKDREDDFFQALVPYVLRRTVEEVAPWIPKKHLVPVPCVMGAKQAKIYRQMQDDGIAVLGDERISASSILAEFTRLSQFANALCEVREGEVMPTTTSCKLEAMLEKMDEADLFDEDSTEKQVVFATSKRFLHVVQAELVHRLGADAVGIVEGGQTKQGQRRQIKEAFNSGQTRVLCIVTSAGGVSLSLTGTKVAHFLDEPWAPDEAQQAEDRLHGIGRGILGERTTIFQYRTVDTIDEYRRDVAADKASAQAYIMDVRRQLLKAKENAA